MFNLLDLVEGGAGAVVFSSFDFHHNLPFLVLRNQARMAQFALIVDPFDRSHSSVVLLDPESCKYPQAHRQN
jgi:hypothetical protein